MSALAGFLLAVDLRHQFKIVALAGLLVGMSLVIACGCVINNCIDRRLDALMSRTSKRALVTRQIPLRNAVIYGVILGVLGFAVLMLFTNPITTFLGVVGLFFYLVMYSIFKRRSPIGTVVGSVSGATPIAAGYTAMSGRFDFPALLLFLSMVAWQMPHFYAIAMYRRDDYRKAGLPVLSVAKGMHTTKVHTLLYIGAFLILSTALSAFGYTHLTFLAIMLALGLAWLYKGISGFNRYDDVVWGKQMFFYSLVVLLAYSAALSVGVWLP